jgi:hypothetical protein
LKPLPLHIPEVYQLCTRIVDAEGYVHVNRVRYSAPYRLIGAALEVRETLDRVVSMRDRAGSRAMRGCTDRWDTRVTDPVHRPPRGFGHRLRPQPAPEEIEILLTLEPQIAGTCGTETRGRIPARCRCVACCRCCATIRAPPS